MSQLIQVLEQDVSPWPVATLGDGLLENVQPGFACGNHNSEGEGIVHVRPYNVTTDGRMDFSTLKFIPISEVTKPERLLSQGDVVFNNTNSPELVGKTAFYADSEERAFSNHMTRIRVNQDKLRPEYLALALHQLWREGYFADKCNNHVSQASISRTVLLETEIALPPLSEQDRLVEALAATEEAVDRARDRLATIPALLKKFRQSVLATACSGQLTADWRDSQIETDIDDIGSIPETWKVQPFHSIIQELRNGVSPRPSMAPPGVPLLRISSTRAMSVDLNEVRYLPQGERFLPQFGLLDGDLLFTRYNGSLELLGVCGMVRGLNGRSLLYPDKLMRVRLKPEVADPRFIEIFFSGPGARERMTLSSRSTAGQQGVSGKDVKEQLVVLPPMSEQVEIVRRVESLFALADSIESRLAEATAQVERTTQAILAKAFRGDLC